VAQPYNASPHQLEGYHLLCGPATHVLLRGGARSGKTVQIIRFLVNRALSASGSTHAIFRNTFASTRTSLIKGTVPLVMEMCFPNREYLLRAQQGDDSSVAARGDRPRGSHATTRSGSGHRSRNASRSRICGGQEHASIFLNECSQIIIYAAHRADGANPIG